MMDSQNRFSAAWKTEIASTLSAGNFRSKDKGKSRREGNNNK